MEPVVGIAYMPTHYQIVSGKWDATGDAESIMAQLLLAKDDSVI
jgi:hypothetical protein